jgi:hypothetical protein
MLAEGEGEEARKSHTLTFLPASFTVYSIVVRRPFSSTNSSNLLGASLNRSDVNPCSRS